MRIYSMTATFGKLEHQVLNLEPGLNVIEAPNEWGKSTWCAFMVAMLYGIDTRERGRQGSLPDKERYAPWSGSPMSGRMDICWNGRDITLERSSRGRAVFGEFKAYETATGLPVPELTGTNCGEMLLGVEKSVFVRAGFVRLTDMPVSDDEALRRRLNALVTTGDESGAGDALAQKLKALKNRCRHNKTGLLPQAEGCRDALRDKLSRLEQLRQQSAQLTKRQEAVGERLRALENHQLALEYEKSLQDSEKLEAANQVLEAARQRWEDQKARCAGIADRETAQMQMLHLEQLQLQQEALMAQTVPPEPKRPEAPPAFVGMKPEQAVRQAKKDKADYEVLCRPGPLWCAVLMVVALLASVALGFADWKLALTPFVLAWVLAVICLRSRGKQRQDRAQLLLRYGTIPPESWLDTAAAWKDRMEEYQKAVMEHTRRLEELNSRKAALSDNIENSTGGLSVGEALDGWRGVLSMHDALDRAYQSFRQAEAHAKTVSDMIKPTQKPAFPDEIVLNGEQTYRQLESTREEYRQLQLLLGQLGGRMESLGEPTLLRQELEQEERKISRLEDVYGAVSLAMDTLSKASAELQRKFAPRISGRAEKLFSGITGGRYERLMLGEDLTLEVRAKDEDNMRSGIWRSDGTLDQLYLALRLAVAEELTPDAPLVLDDALVRFDDQRLALVMDILKTQAAGKQVLLFTCQSRERAYL